MPAPHTQIDLSALKIQRNRRTWERLLMMLALAVGVVILLLVVGGKAKGGKLWEKSKLRVNMVRKNVRHVLRGVRGEGADFVFSLSSASKVVDTVTFVQGQLEGGKRIRYVVPVRRVE